MSGYRPRIGDVIALPAWLPSCPFRVLGVRGDLIPGWVWVEGYLMRPAGIRPDEYRVPLAQVRRLPDPTWPAGEP